jgi:hypothetical protein
MKIGIIGHGADKFTEETKQKAISIIRETLLQAKVDYSKKVRDIINAGCAGSCETEAITDVPTLVSGHSPLGGVDVFAEDIADELSIPKLIFAPKDFSWGGGYGYKARNVDIAKNSDVLHIIVVSKYPPNYVGKKFEICYHCNSTTHIKSGACWTGNLAKTLGKKVVYHIINT